MPRSRTLAVGLAALGLVLPVAAPAEAKRFAFGDRAPGQGSRGRDVRVLQRLPHPRRAPDRPSTASTGRTRPAACGRGSAARSASASTGACRAARRASCAPRSQQGIRVFEPHRSRRRRRRARRRERGARRRRPRVAPASAPPRRSRRAIAAANKIVGKPYKYGGGHGRWNDSGYDCSGAMSYALHGAGLLNRPLTSGDFMSWGSRPARAPGSRSTPTAATASS